jgi:hypothetical protein
MSMLFRTAQIVLRAADFALTQTHYAAAFTKTLDVYFLATHDACSNFVAEPCRLRGRLSACRFQIEPETQKIGIKNPTLRRQMVVGFNAGWIDRAISRLIPPPSRFART